MFEFQWKNVQPLMWFVVCNRRTHKFYVKRHVCAAKPGKLAHFCHIKISAKRSANMGEAGSAFLHLLFTVPVESSYKSNPLAGLSLDSTSCVSVFPGQKKKSRQMTAMSSPVWCRRLSQDFSCGMWRGHLMSLQR